MNKRTLVIMGFSAASYLIGAWTAHYFTKKALDQFYIEQIDVEVAAAIALHEEFGTTFRDVKVYRNTEDIPRDPDQHEPIPAHIQGADGRVHYNKVRTAENSSATVASPVVAAIQEAEEELGMDNPELATLRAMQAENERLMKRGLPYVISQEEAYEDIDEFSNESLTYYAGDQVLANDQDEVLDITTTVGDGNLEKFGYLSEPNILCIRNDDQRLLLEVKFDPGMHSVIAG